MINQSQVPPQNYYVQYDYDCLYKNLYLLGSYFLSNLLFGLENVVKMILFCTNLYSAKKNKDKDIGYTFIYYNDNLA